ncbi:MAG: RNA methyltransferase [Methylococcales bacterium]|nr:RNA methyltransferase [Methylococcales bacterium]
MHTVKIVLVGTTHPGNIGATARAMKTMNFSRLALVAPKQFPSAEASARAAGADDILAQAYVYDTLAEAVADCQWVIGASARRRSIQWPELTPRQCAAKLTTLPEGEQAALVFGREHSGLSNAELDLCQFLLHIPVNPEFSSLNLAAAVQVVCYELYQARLDNGPHTHPTPPEAPPASAEQLERFYQHLQDTLLSIGFLRPEQQQSMMRRLRRLYHRAQLDRKEVDILRGILSMTTGFRKR